MITSINSTQGLVLNFAGIINVQHAFAFFYPECLLIKYLTVEE